jgi:hypothetical protein
MNDEGVLYVRACPWKEAGRVSLDKVPGLEARHPGVYLVFLATGWSDRNRDKKLLLVFQSFLNIQQEIFPS